MNEFIKIEANGEYFFAHYTQISVVRSLKGGMVFYPGGSMILEDESCEKAMQILNETSMFMIQAKQKNENNM
jgi:hypothetical protein